jgi:hypothetical protein
MNELARDSSLCGIKRKDHLMATNTIGLTFTHSLSLFGLAHLLYPFSKRSAVDPQMHPGIPLMGRAAL